MFSMLVICGQTTSVPSLCPAAVRSEARWSQHVFQGG